MQKKLLTNGNIFKRTDNRWNGVAWFMDEQGERKRKSFSGVSKTEVKKRSLTILLPSINHWKSVINPDKHFKPA